MSRTSQVVCGVLLLTPTLSKATVNVMKESKVAQSCLTLSDPMDCSPWNSPGQNTGVSSLSLLQGIFPTQEWNQGLQHCRRILYQLSYQEALLWWVKIKTRPLHNCICTLTKTKAFPKPQEWPNILLSCLTRLTASSLSITELSFNLFLVS